jgi:hypothetical protein
MKDNDTPVIALLKTPSIDLPQVGRLTACDTVEDTLTPADHQSSEIIDFFPLFPMPDA